jgi:hypothetical protein
VALNDHVREVRSALTNPRALCEKLGLLKGAKPQAGDGVSICCPVHGERDPSCSVSRGPDGTIRVKCFACDFATDALGLIANVEGLSLRGEFREVLARGAEFAGHLVLRDEILQGRAIPDRERVAAPEPAPLPEFPPQSEVEALWGAGIPTSADPDVWEYLRSRGFAPERLDESKLAVALPPKTKTPPWASYARQSWVETGHRILVPMWDKVGSLVTVRAWRVTDGDTPKRLPPKGHRATGCVMANPLALGMLRGQVSPVGLEIVEGEPDFLTACLAYDRAVIGINSGSWCDEIARRVPNGTKVIINTHHDEAGERYADQVVATLGNRVAWWRSAP